MWRGHGQEAKRGEAGGHRITRNCEAIGSFLLPCAATGVSLLAVWCLSGATPRGQPWTPAVTLPHGCDGLSARRMAVLWTFREPSLCRHVRRELCATRCSISPLLYPQLLATKEITSRHTVGVGTVRVRAEMRGGIHLAAAASRGDEAWGRR